jgi:hypothetical protein
VSLAAVTAGCAGAFFGAQPGSDPATDARILHALARLRGKNDITFGVWCEPIQPGNVHVGNPVIPP